MRLAPDFDSETARTARGWDYYNRHGATVTHMRDHLAREEFIVPPRPEPERIGVLDYVFGVLGIALVAAVCVAWLVL
jgi:hypothetical protein